jgi:hypothetical protein
LNFRTAFQDKNGMWVSSTRKIACNYLQSWFLVDFLSTFPISAVYSFAKNGGNNLPTTGASTSSGGTARANKLIRLVRLVKLGRLLRLGNSMPTLQR